MGHRDYLRQGQGIGVKAWRQKAVATSRVNTIVLTDDPELQIPVTLVGNPLLVRGQLFQGALSNTPDIRVGLNFTGAFGGGSAFLVNGIPTTSTNTGPQQVANVGRITWNVGFVACAAVANPPVILPSVITFEGILYAQTAGVVSVRWCQNVSNAAGVAVGVGSWMSVERMDNVGVL